jgi:hypothetical protein
MHPGLAIQLSYPEAQIRLEPRPRRRHCLAANHGQCTQMLSHIALQCEHLGGEGHSPMPICFGRRLFTSRGPRSGRRARACRC